MEHRHKDILPICCGSSGPDTLNRFGQIAKVQIVTAGKAQVLAEEA